MTQIKVNIVKTTQQFFNWYITQYNLSTIKLDVDGIVGKQTKTIEAIVIQHIKQQFSLNNYIWEIDKPNTIFYRTNNIFNNQYEDWMVIIKQITEIDFNLYVFKCTTKAGNFYVQNPVTVGGITGTAILKPGQYRNTWKFITAVNWKTLWTQHPYFYQVLPVNIWRDKNKDNTINKEISTSGLFGINWHRGGISSLIDRWSAACLVVPRDNWLEVIALNLYKENEVYTGTLFEIE